MKTSFATLLLASAIASANAQITETATDAVKNMGLGWNLGNTFDASGNNITGDVTNDAYWGCQGLESETYWGQRTTKKELFPMMKNAGFGAIRVPVTWYNHMDKDGNVDAEWMARVHEVVDYVLDAGLYCIVNVHHDTGADSNTFKSWLKADMDTYNNQKERYEYLWKQIAEEFKDYDQHLLFESYNEMLDIKSSWCFASYNTKDRYDAEIAKSAYDAINNYAQSFVNSVRATGGNNSQRNLIVNTYGACCGSGNWNAHLTDPLSEMKIPEDKAKDHIIFEVHTYPSISNNGKDRAWSEIKDEIDQMIKVLKDNLVSKGAPVIFGEWGTSNVDAGDGKTDYDVRRDLMFDFASYFVKQAKENNMATFYWMGLTDGTYRTYPAFNQPDLAECLAKAYHGADFQGEYLEYEQPATLVCFEGSKDLAWGNGITIEAQIFKNAGENCELVLSYIQMQDEDDDIQLYYGNWSDKAKFIVEGHNYTADFNPSKVYGTKANTNHETIVAFPRTDYEKIASLGLVIHGIGIKVQKVVVKKVDTAGFETIRLNESSSALFNLEGKVVDNNYRGIVIKNGKVIFNR